MSRMNRRALARAESSAICAPLSRLISVGVIGRSGNYSGELHRHILCKALPLGAAIAKITYRSVTRASPSVAEEAAQCHPCTCRYECAFAPDLRSSQLVAIDARGRNCVPVTKLSQSHRLNFLTHLWRHSSQGRPYRTHADSDTAPEINHHNPGPRIARLSCRKLLDGRIDLARIKEGMESPLCAERLMTPTADDRGGIGLLRPTGRWVFYWAAEVPLRRETFQPRARRTRRQRPTTVG